MANGNEGMDERIIAIISNLYVFCNFEAQFLFSVVTGATYQLADNVYFQSLIMRRRYTFSFG